MLPHFQSVHFIGICGTAMASVAAALVAAASSTYRYFAGTTDEATDGNESDGAIGNEHKADEQQLCVLGTHGDRSEYRWR